MVWGRKWCNYIDDRTQRWFLPLNPFAYPNKYGMHTMDTCTRTHIGKPLENPIFDYFEFNRWWILKFIGNWKCSTAPIQRNLNQANLRIQQQSISNHSIQIIIVVVTPLRVAASCGLFLLANMQRHIALSMDMDPIVCIIKFKSAWESPHSLRPLTKCI